MCQLTKDWREGTEFHGQNSQWRRNSQKKWGGLGEVKIRNKLKILQMARVKDSQESKTFIFPITNLEQDI